jgi:hypothetical protein
MLEVLQKDAFSVQGANPICLQQTSQQLVNRRHDFIKKQKPPQYNGLAHSLAASNPISEHVPLANTHPSRALMLLMLHQYGLKWMPHVKRPFSIPHHLYCKP